jgi:GTP-binding protein HflX
MNNVPVQFRPAILVALGNARNPEMVEEHLNELAFLAETAGLREAGRIVQNLPKPDPRTFIGKGKVAELQTLVQRTGATEVIFDDDLTPSQLRNLERELNPRDAERNPVRIYDRSLLILDIFLIRAKTAQARTQVELARNQYLLPRLTRMWTHLERQRGGTGTRGGAGEKEIETDRRNIRHQIAVLKERLKRIEQQRFTQRKARQDAVRVALVGYTNAGKSTLMNVLSGAQVLAENRLFATVDSTVRKVRLGNVSFLLSDTVGFIRKLPHHLIESFKSTLDEVREADILLHVVDVSHPFHHNQIEVVNQTLRDIGAGNKTTLLVLNKIDAFRKAHPEIKPEDMEGFYRQQGLDHILMVSAVTGENIPELKRKLYEEVRKVFMTIYPNYLKDTFALDFSG